MPLHEPPGQVIVLGGGLRPDGQPTQETTERVLSAVHYTAVYGAERVVLSGGIGYLADGLAAEIAEADVMRDVAIGHGMDPARISGLDRQSRSTFETFLNVRPMLRPEQTAIITHAYHLPRALHMARLVLPMELVGYEAFAEYTGKVRPPANERFLRLATQLVMQGVEPGNETTMRRRNEALARALSAPSRLKLIKATLLRNHTSVQGAKE